MTTLTLHAGMHKTGTSSIQQTLAALPAGRGPQFLMAGGHANSSGMLKVGFTENSSYTARNPGRFSPTRLSGIATRPAGASPC